MFGDLLKLEIAAIDLLEDLQVQASGAKADHVGRAIGLANSLVDTINAAMDADKIERGIA